VLTGVMVTNGHGGADGLDCIQGEGLNGEETEGEIDGRSEAGV
jgi:hypothetical protein